jgi:ABC-type transport system involved in cytochrome c biogenesis permease subunit
MSEMVDILAQIERPPAPPAGQLVVLCTAIALFVIGGLLSLLRLRASSPADVERFRIAAKACAYLGACAALAVLIWHSAQRGSWLPLEDNFDALVWLGLLLALFVLYIQRRRPVGGLDWFLMPIVILLLASAAIFGSAKPHVYVTTTWSWVHRGTAFAGIVAFAVAGAVGLMYLIVNHRLRTKRALLAGPNLGNLERLEHLTLESVSLGFALLTIGALTGINEMVKGKHTSPAKLVLTAALWLVYAVVLHAPINPSFRGRKAAVLSVIGLALTVGTMVAVLVTSGRR